jgi:hypothetical protein
MATRADRRAAGAALALAAGLAFLPPSARGGTKLIFPGAPDSVAIKVLLQPRFTWNLSGNTEPATSWRVRRSRVGVGVWAAPRLYGAVLIEARPEKTEVLDAYLNAVPFSGVPQLSVRVGQFKRPFSRQEFLVSAGDLNLIDRSSANAFLEGNLRMSSWDLGGMATFNERRGAVPYRVDFAIMNGTGRGFQEDLDSGKQVLLRGAVDPASGLSLGANVSFHRLGVDDGARTRLVWGMDAAAKGSVRGGEVRVLSEIFGGDNYASVLTDPVQPADVPGFLAWYGQVVVRFDSGWQPGLQVEVIDPDTGVSDTGRIELTVQGAYAWSSALRWQVNLVHVEPNAGNAESEDALISQWTVQL